MLETKVYWLMRKNSFVSTLRESARETYQSHKDTYGCNFSLCFSHDLLPVNEFFGHCKEL